MGPYVDSGILIKLYVRERNSEDAIQVLREISRIYLNQLQELEIRNTFRILEGRGVITPFQGSAAEHLLDEDIISRRLQRTPIDWGMVFSEAQNLSKLYAIGTLARSLDILHVAAALVSGLKHFITADRRQLAIAMNCGLKVQLIE